MKDVFVTLIYNVALLMVLGNLHNLAYRAPATFQRRMQLLSGLAIGGIAIALMLTPWELAPGLIFDTRTVLMSVSALFFGHIPALIGALVAMIFRLAMGGGGVWMGVGTIITATALGLAWRYHLARRGLPPDASRLIELYNLGVVVHIAMLLWVLVLPVESRQPTWQAISAPVLLLYPVATVALASLLKRDRANWRTQQTLNSAQERLTRIFYDSPYPIAYRTISDGRIIDLNQAYATFFGRTREEMIGQSVYEMDLWADPAERMRVTEEAAGGEARTIEARLRNRRGETRTVELTLYKLRHSDDEIIVMFADVTERREAERVLAESERRFRSAVENAPFPIVIFDEGGEILSISRAWTQITGYTHADIPTVDAWLERAYDSRREEIKAGIEELFSASDTVDEGEFEIITKDGSRRIWSISSSLLGYWSGDRRLMMSIAADVTERKRMEETLRESEQRFRNAVDFSPAPFLIYAEDREVIHISRTWTEVTGYTLEDIPTYDRWLKLGHGNDNHELLSFIDSLFTEDAANVDEDEYEITTKDGSRRVWLSRGALLGRLPDGRRLRGVMAMDVTERKRVENALRDSQEQFALFMQHFPGYAFIKDAEGRHLFVNHRFAHRCNGDVQSLLGKTDFDFWPRDHAERFRERDLLIINSLTAQVNEERIEENGVWHTFLTTKFPIVRQDGSVLIGGISFEVTALREAEARLREERNLLRTLIDTIPDLISVKDRAHRLILANTAVERRYGMPMSEILGKTDFELNSRRAQEHWDDEEEMLKTGRTIRREILADKRAWPAHEGPIYYLIHKVPLRNDKGEVVGLVGVNRDITEQWRAQETLRAALEREQVQRVRAEGLRRSAEVLARAVDFNEALAQAAESLRTLVAYDQLLIQAVERDRLTSLYSAGLDEHALGLGSSQAYTQIAPLHAALTAGGQITLDEIAHAPERAELLDVGENLDAWMGVALVSRQITLGILRIGRKDGAFSADEIGVIRAFASQIALALDHERVVRELAESYAQLQQAQESLMRAVRLSAIGELAAGVAHQINNPLTTVVADSQLLLQDLAPDKLGYESAQAIHRAAQRAATTVQRLLNFARTRPSAFHEVDVNDTLRQAVDTVRPQLDLQHMALHTELTSPLPPVAASEEHLLDVWMNLLLNARDAVSGQETGRITVTTGYDPADSTVIVAVRDNGAGITPEARSQLFAPFYTTKERGTGLGLPICADIIEQHRGSIQVESEVGRGATFIVRLPAVRPIAHTPS